MKPDQLMQANQIYYELEPSPPLSRSTPLRFLYYKLYRSYVYSAGAFAAFSNIEFDISPFV